MRKHRFAGVVIATVIALAAAQGAATTRHNGRAGMALASASLHHPPATGAGESMAEVDRRQFEARARVTAFLEAAARAQAAAYLEALARARPTPPPNPWPALRQCESGDNYRDDTGNGYFGAYQFTLGSWRSLGFGGLPSQAAPAQQDQAARELQSRRGWGQWPACSRRLGLT